MHVLQKKWIVNVRRRGTKRMSKCSELRQRRNECNKKIIWNTIYQKPSFKVFYLACFVKDHFQRQKSHHQNCLIITGHVIVHEVQYLHCRCIQIGHFDMA